MLPGWEKCWNAGLEYIAKVGVAKVIGAGVTLRLVSYVDRGTENDALLDQAVVCLDLAGVGVSKADHFQDANLETDG